MLWLSSHKHHLPNQINVCKSCNRYYCFKLIVIKSEKYNNRVALPNLPHQDLHLQM